MVKEVVRYIEGSCISCGRGRIEEYTNGDIICEKCGMNQLTRQYEDLDELAEEQMKEQRSSSINEMDVNELFSGVDFDYLD